MRTYSIAPASCCISRFAEPRVGTVGKLEEDAQSSRDCRLYSQQQDGHLDSLMADTAGTTTVQLNATRTHLDPDLTRALQGVLL